MGEAMKGPEVGRGSGMMMAFIGPSAPLLLTPYTEQWMTRLTGWRSQQLLPLHGSLTLVSVAGLQVASRVNGKRHKLCRPTQKIQ